MLESVFIFLGLALGLSFLLGLVNWFLKVEFLKIIYERRFGFKLDKMEKEKKCELKKELSEIPPDFQGIHELEKGDILWQYRKKKLLKR